MVPSSYPFVLLQWSIEPHRLARELQINALPSLPAIDELPIPASELAPLLRGIILVDHPVPLSVWSKAKILSIFDHHTDRGAAPNAYPRLFEKTASCTTIVSREMLNELEKMKTEYHVPHEVYELSL